MLFYLRKHTRNARSIVNACILEYPRLTKHCKYHVSQNSQNHKIARTTRSVPDPFWVVFAGDHGGYASTIQSRQLAVNEKVFACLRKNNLAEKGLILLQMIRLSSVFRWPMSCQVADQCVPALNMETPWFNIWFTSKNMKKHRQCRCDASLSCILCSNQAKDYEVKSA